MADRRQRVVVDGGFKLVISFEWGTTRISVRTIIILNIYQ